MGATNQKAQAAIEVLAYAAFFLLVFLIGWAVFMQLQQQELLRAEHSYAQEIAYEFADHIRTAFMAGPGFWENFTLPSSIHGKPYKVRISRGGAANAQETGFVYVEWMGTARNASFSAPTITAAYDATAYSGFINVSGNFITISPSGYPGLPLNISNENGRIRLKRGY